MLLSVLFENPMMFFVVIAGIVYAFTIHEFSGRLSLNPLVHLDMFGTMMLLLAGFGWGKPVPVNIFNLKYKRWGESLVALAGPMANFVSAILFILLFKLAILFFPAENMIFSFLFYMILINLVLGVFNLIPLPP